MGTSIREIFKPLPPATWPDSSSVTSSPASEDGRSRSSSPAGRQLDLFGQAPALANPSAPPASAKVGTTVAISGRIGRGSSASAALSRSLASRLRARLPMGGSTLFSMTWREWITPAGRHVSRLAASARSISGNGSTSWPTPDAGAHNLTDSTWEVRRAQSKAKHQNGNGFGLTLGQAATWATPTSRDHKDGSETPHVPINALLGRQVWSTWATPTRANARHAGSRNTPTSRAHAGQSVTDQARGDRGTGRSGSTAETASVGQLNPAFSRWLMGYPPEWDACAVTAMPSCRKSRPKS